MRSNTLSTSLIKEEISFCVIYYKTFDIIHFFFITRPSHFSSVSAIPLLSVSSRALPKAGDAQRRTASRKWLAAALALTRLAAARYYLTI